jgi:hypothetical protein
VKICHDLVHADDTARLQHCDVIASVDSGTMESSFSLSRPSGIPSFYGRPRLRVEYATGTAAQEFAVAVVQDLRSDSTARAAAIEMLSQLATQAARVPYRLTLGPDRDRRASRGEQTHVASVQSGFEP